MKKIYTRILSLLFIFPLYTNATTLRDSVVNTINSNPDILSEYFNKKSFKTDVLKEQGDYYPTVDFAIYAEDSQTKYNLHDNTQTDGKKNGWNATLKIEQVLYDGGLTPNEVEMFQHRYQNVKYTSKDKVEGLILDIVNTYLDLVSYQEFIALDKYNIKVHNKYLKLAKDKEAISGEILDSYEVSSKIRAIQDDYLKQEVSQQKALSAYKKLTGQELTGNICRPKIDEKLFPPTYQEAIEVALRNNNQIYAQHEIIKEQTTRVLVEDAKFKPDLKLQLQGEWDDDLAEAENGRRDIYTVRLQSNWNFYNGGKDTLSREKEKITVLEQRKILDAIKNDVIDKIKGSYKSYFKIKDRLKNLLLFISDNKKIVEIYNKQLEDGSRTFIDVLNAEAELFRTKLLYIETEFSLFKEYYNILKSLNLLSDSILMHKSTQCIPYVFDESEFKIKEDKPQSEEELANELGLD